MLIVLEGLDGAGKSTQVRMLRHFLENECGRLEYIHFPRYDAPVYGELISRYLRGDFGSLESVHPQLVALLFAEDRHGAARMIRNVLDQGGTVLLDRYVYSNIAYQCAKLPAGEQADALREWIISTEYGVFGLPRPDINIFLDVPTGFVRDNLGSGREGDDRAYLQGHRDIHESDMAFQMRVRDIYRREAGLDPSFITVDCGDASGRMLPSEAIFNKIKQVYENNKKV